MYHYTIDRAKNGPVDETELRGLVARGEVKPTDLCWTSGWPQWKTIGEAFPAGAAEPPPLSPPLNPPMTANAEDGNTSISGTPVQPKRCGLATASLVFGILTIVLFPLFFLFMLPAIICGHMAQAKIKQAKGALMGGGMALTGLIMGYCGVAMVPIGGLMVAMAVPAFHKVRMQSIEKTMDNDARQLSAAAQQYFMENEVKTVQIGYDSVTGKINGPLATYAPQLGKGYTRFPSVITVEDGFILQHPTVRKARAYDAEGRHAE